MPNENKQQQLYCPYCDEELEDTGSPQCQACGVQVFYCPQCGKTVPRDKRVCPYCGADIRRAASREK